MSCQTVPHVHFTLFSQRPRHFLQPLPYSTLIQHLWQNSPKTIAFYVPHYWKVETYAKIPSGNISLFVLPSSPLDRQTDFLRATPEIRTLRISLFSARARNGSPLYSIGGSCLEATGLPLLTCPQSIERVDP